MCAPAVFAALGASAGTAATLSTVAQVGGAILSGVSAMQQAEAAQDQANYNAVVAENNAKMAEYQAADARARGEQEAINARRKGDAVRGSQRATMAARGLSLSEGTPLSLLDQTDYFSGVDQATARNNANKEAFMKESQAANSRTEATMYRAAADSYSPLMSGVSAGVSSYASSSMLGKSGGTVADKWNFWGTSGTGGTGLKATVASAGW